MSYLTPLTLSFQYFLLTKEINKKKIKDNKTDLLLLCFLDIAIKNLQREIYGQVSKPEKHWGKTQYYCGKTQ